MARRLEAGWLQKIAWSALVWCSLGLLAWVPFLYVAIRRRRPSDWGAFAAFALYEAVTLPWASTTGGNSDGDPVLGAVAILTWLVATAMLLFAVFDKPAPEQPLYGATPTPLPPGQGQPYGYPYGR
jgi:hypothetical protein